ncbi:capsid and scaffold protein [Salmonella phage 40]|nr:capsid and scaffold protein [Salmonella phage 40]
MLKSLLKFIKDLVRSPVDPDKASHTKFWSNIGLASMTAVFLYWGFNGTLPSGTCGFMHPLLLHLN